MSLPPNVKAAWDAMIQGIYRNVEQMIDDRLRRELGGAVRGGQVAAASIVGSLLTVKEQDGAPTVSGVREIRVSNGTLTDNGGGAVSITTGGGGGSVATDTIWDAKGDLAVGTGADVAQRLAVGADGTVLTADSAQPTGLKWASVSAGTRATLLAVIDGGGAAITTGVKLDVRVDFACTIRGWRLYADQAGSIVVDIWKDTHLNFPPTVADTITGSAKPTLSAADHAEDTTLTGWTTAIAAGDVLRINVDSAATIQRVTLALEVERA